MNAMVEQVISGQAWTRLSLTAADVLCELAVTGSLFGAVMVVAGPVLSDVMRRIRASGGEAPATPRYLWVD